MATALRMFCRCQLSALRQGAPASMLGGVSRAGISSSATARAEPPTTTTDDSSSSDEGLRGTGDGVLSEPAAPGEESMKPATSTGGRVNPVTGEVNGPRGPEPTRYGDWENKGRCSDF
eukprot:m.371765 g.371765  ORF g.371765 m.371765 type:complete len:118 (+) comp28134_c1_seq6:150-503(+)